MEGVDVFDMRPLDASRMGMYFLDIKEDPIKEDFFFFFGMMDYIYSFMGWNDVMA